MSTTNKPMELFANIPEQNRPKPTGRIVRHGGVEYRNPGLPERLSLCIGTGFSERLFSPTVWDKKCNEREARAASAMLAALRLVVESGPIANADPNTQAIANEAIAAATNPTDIG